MYVLYANIEIDGLRGVYVNPKKIGAEIILSVIVAPFIVWTVTSIYSVQAKADRVIAVEEKIDYIYKFLIEKHGEIK